MNKIKELTSTPKKMAIFVACVICAVAILAAGSYFAVYAVVDNQSIGKDRALEIALTDAGYSADQIAMSRTDLSYDDGMFEYEVEFVADGIEYDYTIKASNGVILKIDTEGVRTQGVTGQPGAPQTDDQQTAGNSEADDSTAQTGNTAQIGGQEENSSAAGNSSQTGTSGNSAQTGTSGNSTQMGTSGNVSNSASLTENEAKAVALADAGLTEGAVRFIRAELDRDDGRLHYDIDFVTDDTEYDYEIDASTGNIISKQAETFGGTGGNSGTSGANTGSGNITIEEAQNIALSHAGVSAADARFTKTKLDYDDGISKYEIEFVVGTYEYDYEINAANGTIIEYDIDRD